MKKILITGENSYIGTSFVSYMEEFKSDYEVNTISVRGEDWKNKDFSDYDVVYHVAGIAHQKETESNKDLYYEVNYQLTKEVALKAKESKVRQFIFLSSMSVYGKESGSIGKNTLPEPKSYYGNSKRQAELFLETIEDEDFKVCTVRPPMVYGRDCKGNYVTMAKIVKKLPIFPKINNQRSMIFIDNLSFSIKKIIDEEISGVICPQNQSFVCTSDLAKEIKQKNGKNIYLSFVLGMSIKLLKKNNMVNKIFGDLFYDFFDIHNVPYDFIESINLTEDN